MGNEVMPFGGGVDLTDEDALARQLSEDADFGARAGDISYMSFSGKRGAYKIGVEGRSPEPSEPFLVAVPLFKTGYIAWKGGRPIAKRMAGMNEPRVMQPDPDEGGPFDPNRGEGWFSARSLFARSLFNGEQIEFTNNSRSGVAVIADLHKDVVARLRAGEPAWPIVEFGMEEFTSNGHTNFKPMLVERGWLTTDQINDWTDPDFDPMTWIEDEPASPKKVEPRKRRADL